LHQRIAEALEAMPGNVAEREPESLTRHWFAAGQDGRGEVYWLWARHRVAHWQEQLDALADYLDAGAAEIIPIHGAPGVQQAPLGKIPIRLNHQLQSSLRAERSNLGPPSARSVEIASSRKALLAMTVCRFGRICSAAVTAFPRRSMLESSRGA
jgi:hypothetical protein